MQGESLQPVLQPYVDLEDPNTSQARPRREPKTPEKGDTNPTPGPPKTAERQGETTETLGAR